MSTTPAATTSQTACCDLCYTSRTTKEFLRNHVKTHVTTEPGQLCYICLDEFGSIKPESGTHDVACQINLPGCSHIFGHACLLRILSTGGNCCPLCRTQWCNAFRPAERNVHGRLMVHPEMVTEWAGIFCTPISAARLIVCMKWHVHMCMVEGGRQELYASDRLFYMNAREHHRFEEILHVISHSKDIQTHIKHLQNTQPDPIDARLYDPYTNTQGLFDGGDIWRFRNWLTPERPLAIIVLHALLSSNGQRLLKRFFLVTELNNLKKGMRGGVTQPDALGQEPTTSDVIATQDPEAPAEGTWMNFAEQILQKLEDDWVQWYGEEEVRVFSRFLINVVVARFKASEKHPRGAPVID